MRNQTHKTIRLSLILLMFINGISFAQTGMKQPQNLSDEKWAALKAAIADQRLNINNAFDADIGVSLDYDSATNRVVLGAPNSSDNGFLSGVVYVFELINGSWTQTAKVLPPQTSIYTRFGGSVAIDGDWLVVGALDQGGAVYVFRLIGSDWVFDTIRTPPKNQSGGYGESVDIAHETIVIGNHQGLNAVGQNRGNVIILNYDQNTFTWHETTIYGSSNTSRFGYAIDLDDSGYRLAVGAPTQQPSGAVYLFDRVKDKVNDVWQQTTVLTGSAVEVGSWFGHQVSLDDDVLTSVGLFLDADMEDVYVFELVNGVWQETGVLSDGVSNSDFGLQVKVFEDTLAITRTSPNGILFYTNSNMGWQLSQTLDTSDSIGYRPIDIENDILIAGDSLGGAQSYRYNPNILMSDMASQGPPLNCEIEEACWEPANAIVSTDLPVENKFGIALDVSGNRAVVGAYHDDEKGENAGAAYVFEYGGAPSSPSLRMWRQTKKLTANFGGAGDLFGRSVAIDGDRIVVGAYLDDYFANLLNAEDAGSVYVFDYENGAWNQSAILQSGESFQTAAGDFFGFSVDVYGDRILVGSHQDDEAGKEAGAAYVFDLIGGSTWQNSLKLMPTNLQAGDAFGFAVDLDNNRALIGAYADDEMGVQAGGAYVYRFIPQANVWLLDDKLLPQPNNAGGYFGAAVSLDDDWALIGAPLSSNNDIPAVEQAGKAYFFQRLNTGVWNLNQAVTHIGGVFDDQFGYAVDLEGNRALISAWRENDLGIDSGAAYVYRLSDVIPFWQQSEKINPSFGVNSGDFFGVSVAIEGGQFLIGAHLDEFNTQQENSGSVFSFFDDLIFENGFE